MPTRRHVPASLSSWGLAICLGLAVTGAGLSDVAKPKPRPNPATAQAMPDSAAGSYLAARAASTQHDFAAATDLYDRALALDPTNPTLLTGAVAARLATGDLNGASVAARVLLGQGSKDQTAILAALAADAAAGDFAGIKTDLSGGHSIGQMTDALVLAWAELGQGSMTDALAAFDTLATNGTMRGYALYHKGLALALSGDFEGAETIFSGPDLGAVRDTRRAITARVQALAQLDRRTEAIAVLDQAFPAGIDTTMDALRAQLKTAAPVPFDVVTSPRDGVAEVLYDMGTALSGQADDAYVLLFVRTAAALRPTHVEAVMMSAQLLQRLGQQVLAGQVYALIPPDNPTYVDATIGQANALLATGAGDQAVVVLTGLSASHPGNPDLAQSLADALRRQKRYAEAVPAYDTAIGLAGTPGPADWGLFYARGICLTELKRWPEAEADFRKALVLKPGQPQVLNYLGYSYVDRGENLDEALQMIQRAVLAAPDQGYIVDSLGWALFRLGRAKDAVVPMERASLLLPVDAVVTDHLGDVYWAVGRQMEARFQWRRALSFDPAEADATRINLKLQLGLDAVLEQEKAAKLAPAAATPAPAATAPATPSPAPAASGDGNGG